MRLLLDSHIAIWAALSPAALTDGERNRMSTADGPLVLSSVAVWELRLKWSSLTISGERKGAVDPASVVAFAAKQSFIDWNTNVSSARKPSPLVGEGWVRGGRRSDSRAERPLTPALSHKGRGRSRGRTSETLLSIAWEFLPLTARHAAAELAQPLSHKDPFDELLLVQAQEEGLRLLTRDAKLIGHPFAIAGGQD